MKITEQFFRVSNSKSKITVKKLTVDELVIEAVANGRVVVEAAIEAKILLSSAKTTKTNIY